MVCVLVVLAPVDRIYLPQTIWTIFHVNEWNLQTHKHALIHTWNISNINRFEPFDNSSICIHFGSVHLCAATVAGFFLFHFENVTFSFCFFISGLHLCKKKLHRDFRLWINFCMKHIESINTSIDVFHFVNIKFTSNQQLYNYNWKRKTFIKKR